MKKIISNRLTMYGSVRATLNSNQAAWNNVPAFVEAVAQFTQKLSDLNAELIRVESLTEGVKSSRDAKLDEVRVLVTRFVKAFQVLALVNNNPQLREHYGIPVSMIRKFTLPRLQVFLTRLLTDVNANVDVLGEYGIATTDVDRLTALESEFSEMVSTVRNAVIDRSGSNRTIRAIDRDLQLILHEKLDKMTAVIGEDYPELLVAYRKARHIIDHPKGKESGEPSQTDQAA